MNIQAVARRHSGYRHDVEVEGHSVIVDEPEDAGGTDEGPSPTRLLAASLAACTAITMEMYADRKGWDLGQLAVEVDMEQVEPSLPRSFTVTLRLPRDLSEDQVDRLKVIAGKCPVHRALSNETEVSIEDRVEFV